MRGSSQLRKHGDPDRLRGDNDHDEDAVRGEQAIGLLTASELTCDDDADHGRSARDDEQRERRERTTPERTLTG